MDTSKQYIKMCEQAQEIQNVNQIGGMNELGDVYFSKTHNKIFCHFNSNEPIYNVFSGNIFEKIKCIEIIGSSKIEYAWLPRIEDFIYLINESGYYSNYIRFCNEDKSHFIGVDYKRMHYNLFNNFTFNKDVSLEQLWLAFVMKKKYNKTWNSKKEEWEKINY